MKEIAMPAAAEKKGKTIRRRLSALGTGGLIFAILAILCLVAALALIIVGEFFVKKIPQNAYFGYVGFALAGGALLFGGAAGLCARGYSSYEKRVSDYFERLDGQNSFYVGEGTLATFGETLLIHSETSPRRVSIPYDKIRAYRVCTRKAPKETGEWSIVLDLPAGYVGKEQVFVQMDEKPRLNAALQRRSVPVSGESPAPQRKFILKKKFTLPNRKKRMRALIAAGIGVVLAAAGVLVALFANSITVGAVLSVFGFLLTARFFMAFVTAKAVFSVYDAGVYWKESAGREKIFLKWEEIERISPAERDNYPVLEFVCPYATYAFPRAADTFEYLAKEHPEKT